MSQWYGKTHSHIKKVLQKSPETNKKNGSLKGWNSKKFDWSWIHTQYNAIVSPAIDAILKTQDWKLRFAVWHSSLYQK